MNKSLNIWYFHPYACSPLSGKKKPNRSYYLSVEWAKLGHHVKIITSSYEHIGGKKSDIRRGFSVEKIDEIDFVWLFTPQYDGNTWRRILNMLVYARQVKKYSARLLSALGAPDVIICSAQHPFHFDSCRKIAQSSNAILISEIRDLWPLSLIQLLGINKFHPFCLWLFFIEKAMCKQSDSLVSLLQDSREYFISKGLSEKKFYCIPNGYSIPCDTENTSYDLDYKKIKNLKEDGHFVIGYTGAHGKPNQLEILCEAVSKFNDIHLVLIGDGNVKKDLLAKYKDYQNIHFISPKCKSLISGFQRLFDIAYWCLAKSEVFNFGVSPNKIYEYMYNQVPILSGTFPDTPIIQAECGVFFENESLDSLIQAIKFTRDLTKDQLVDIGKRGRRLIENHYLYSKLAKKYIEIMVKLRR